MKKAKKKKHYFVVLYTESSFRIVLVYSVAKTWFLFRQFRKIILKISILKRFLIFHELSIQFLWYICDHWIFATIVYGCLSLYIYIYIYICVCVCVWVCLSVCACVCVFVFRQYFHVEVYLIKYYGQSLSAYFCFNPFKSPYCCFDIWLELANTFFVFNWFPTIFVPLSGPHQVVCILQKAQYRVLFILV